MSDYDGRIESYNKFELYPLMAYNCIDYLVNNNESIFKLLYYTDAEAWKSDSLHPDLTRSQKINLIYAGQPDETKYRIFLDFGMDNPWTVQACLIRISPAELHPTNHIRGNVSMVFEVYSHFAMDHLSNFTTRIDSVTQQFLEVFNGREVGGLGRLYFDARATNRCRTLLSGKIPFKGKTTIMCNWIL